MSKQAWILFDFDGQNHLQRIPQVLQIPGMNELSVQPEILSGGLSDGVLVLHVTCGHLKCDILPTRGMSIWKMWYLEEMIGWHSPVRGPVHPAFVNLAEPSGLGWLDGFDELLVRCGLESNGAPEFDEKGRLRFPLHGRIGNKPASHVAVSIDEQTQEISITGVVFETRFHFTKLQLTTTLTFRLGSHAVYIHDEVENLSDTDSEMQMLYHVNFGAPLLEPGSQVVAAVKKLEARDPHSIADQANWDRYPAPQAGVPEQAYFLELRGDEHGVTQTLLKNASGTRGASLRFRVQQLPYFTLWKNPTSLADGYVTGLEPGTNFPNRRTQEGSAGRVIPLSPRGTTSFELTLAYHPTANEVAAVERRIRG